MEKAKLISLLNDIECRGLRLSIESFECGAHTTQESTEKMRKADAEFSEILTDLRRYIIAEGV